MCVFSFGHSHRHQDPIRNDYYWVPLFIQLFFKLLPCSLAFLFVLITSPFVHSSLFVLYVLNVAELKSTYQAIISIFSLLLLLLMMMIFDYVLYEKSEHSEHKRESSNITHPFKCADEIDYRMKINSHILDRLKHSGWYWYLFL